MLYENRNASRHMRNGLPIYGPHTSGLFRLLNDATKAFHVNCASHVATMVKYSAVRAWPDDPAAQRAILRTMHTQTIAAEQVDGWQQIGGLKCLLFGTYVPDRQRGPQPTGLDAFAGDVHIDAELREKGLTIEILQQWWLHQTRCKQVVCELKLLVDTLLDKGERLTIRLDDGMEGVVEDVVRDVLDPRFALNAYILIDASDRYNSTRKCEASGPLRWAEAANPTRGMSHDVLTAKLRMHDGTPATMTFDPTYRQIAGKCLDSSHRLDVLPMIGGNGIDIEYKYNAFDECGVVKRLIDDPRFTVRDIPLFLERVEPRALRDQATGTFCGNAASVYRHHNMVFSVLETIATFSGDYVIGQFFEEVTRATGRPDPPTGSEPPISEAERLCRRAYDAHAAAEYAERRAAELRRKERANKERALRREAAEPAFTVTRPQVPKEKPTGRQRTADEQRVHDVHVMPDQRAIRAVAFLDKQDREHADKVAREAREHANGLAKLVSDMEKAEATARHVVPARATLNAHLEAVALQ